MIIHGKHLRLFYGGNVVAESTNCVISLKGNTEDVTTKDNAGLATTESVVSKTWTMQVDTLNVSNLGAVLTAAKNGTKINLAFDQTEGNNNATKTLEYANVGGMGFITQIRATFNDREISKVSISLQGTGSLFVTDTVTAAVSSE